VATLHIWATTDSCSAANGIISLDHLVSARQSFSGKLRDECLNQEIFYSLKEAQVVVEQ
jgi:hypothetical protein